jgi:sulfite exporter TauE/SafE
MVLIPKLFPFIHQYKFTKIILHPIDVFQQSIQQIIYKTFAKKYGIVVIGFFNAFLPCGLVYVALSNALVMGDVKNSILTMVAFGVATLPYLFVVMIGKSFILSSKIFNRNKFIWMMNLLIACLLIVRGLNLNIPYISPQISYDEMKVKECCTNYK